MANEYFHEGNICTDFLPKYVFNNRSTEEKI
jgi:hypothetical protein